MNNIMARQITRVDQKLETKQINVTCNTRKISHITWRKTLINIPLPNKKIQQKSDKIDTSFHWYFSLWHHLDLSK